MESKSHAPHAIDRNCIWFTNTGPNGTRDYWLEINVDRATKPRPPPPRGLDVLNAAAGPRSRSLCVDVAALPGLLLKRLLGEGRDDSAALAFVDRSALAALSDDERLAFALNLYHLCIAVAQRSGRYVIWGRDVPWFRRRPPFLALADALRRASLDLGGAYVTPLALEHGWVRAAAPRRSWVALALAGKPPNPLAPWDPPDMDACLCLALQSGVTNCVEIKFRALTPSTRRSRGDRFGSMAWTNLAHWLIPHRSSRAGRRRCRFTRQRRCVRSSAELQGVSVSPSRRACPQCVATTHTRSASTVRASHSLSLVSRAAASR